MTDAALERAAAALSTVGMDERPVSALEREDALFVLTEGTLLYQDGAGTRRVTLRDLTRIHSDQEGLLRVETPAGTALTASLLGFEPGEVQSFFAQVRDATARVKQLPATPLAGAGEKTFAPKLEPAPEEVPQAPPPRREPPQVTTVTAAPLRGPVADAAPETPSLGAVARPEPVVISSSGSSPASPARRPEPRLPEPVTSVPAEEAEDLGPAAQGVAPAVPVASGGQGSALALAAAQASGVPGRLRFLGTVLFVAAIALAYFQFTNDQRLSALWTLLAGGVGTVTLVTLADAVRLLGAVAGRLDDQDPAE